MFERARATDRRIDNTTEATIVISCPDCGQVRVKAALVTVLVNAGPGAAAHVTFACPGCRLRTTNQLAPDALGALRGVGVPLRLLTRPAEADEAHDGPPLSSYDIDAFCAAMDHPAWPNRLP